MLQILWKKVSTLHYCIYTSNGKSSVTLRLDDLCGRYGIVEVEILKSDMNKSVLSMCLYVVAPILPSYTMQ